jgi:hypothetical protein
VIWYEPIPSAFGYRHQYLLYNRIFEGPETIDFQFDSFPKADAKLSGRVLDENGDPLKEFFIDVRTKMNWDVMKNPDGKFYKIIGYHVPFISNDGTFELGGLPDGEVLASVIPFQNEVYEFDRGKEIVLLAGKTSTIELKLTAKDIFYGRVLFRDGSPAVAKPASWPRANILLVMPMPGEGIARGVMSRSVADVEDDGYFAVHLSEAEIEQLKSGRGKLVINIRTAQDDPPKYMGEFPFALLAKDKSKAGVYSFTG